MMVSNQLSGRAFFPKSPTVCIGKPPSGSRKLYLHIWVKPKAVRVYQAAIIYIDAYNPLFEVDTRYSAEWNPGEGHIDPYPVPRNGLVSYGYWIAPGSPCYTWITVVVTWPDGQSAFASVHVEVLPY